MPLWLDESVATYYEGVNNHHYEYYIPKLKAFLEKNGDTNIFDKDLLTQQIDDGIAMHYIVGAMFVDYVIKEYGY